MQGKGKGTVFAFETDTVWGLGCVPNDEEAVDKIYEIKNRDRSKPLILMSNDLLNLLPYVEDVPDNAMELMKKAYPGALTMVFRRSPNCPVEICAGLDTVGIRVPNHEGFWDLCGCVRGNVLATTSANASGESPCKNYEEAVKKFGEVCTIIKPEKVQEQTSASTIAAFESDGSYKILRQGDYII